MKPASDRQERCLADLSGRLQAAGYEGPAVRPILNRGILDITPDLLPALVRRCRDAGSPAARLMAFWLLLEPTSPAELEVLLGSEAVQALATQGLLEEEGGQLRARASLYPLQGGYYFADPILRPSTVPWLTLADYALALATPRKPAHEAADLNPGPGVQTLLNAAHSQRSWGRYATPEGQEICRLNQVLNAQNETCRFVSLESEIPGSFDLITGRLPFVPSGSLVRELAERLRVGGTVALAIRHLTPDGPLLDRVEQWLGGRAGWGLAQLDYASRYLSLQTPLPDLGFDLAGLQAGFQVASESLVFLRRLDPGRPGWRATLTVAPPQKSISELVAAWLEAQERFSQPDWQAHWCPRWSFTQRLFLDPRTGLGYADYSQGFQPAVLDPASAFLLDKIDGQQTASQLLEACAERWPRSLAEDSLAELGRKALIQ